MFIRIPALLIAMLPSSSSAAEPDKAETAKALSKATTFLHSRIACQGGYAWVSGADGKLRNGEGACGPGTVWVQPPGTPAIGSAFLDAYEATGDEVHLKAARDAAAALMKGQLRSGGWNYRIELSGAARREFTYRVDGQFDPANMPKTPAPGGWDIWKQRRHKDDMTLIDDDVTPASLRFLMRLDKLTGFKDKELHDAVMYGLTSTLNAQYPIGAWSHNYDQFPIEPPSATHYPVKDASFPDKWSRIWTKDFQGCYMLNDRITQNMIATMLLANTIYGDKKYLESARRGGDFVRRAQLPDPQPGWSQEYTRDMQPCWDRKFEPPAVTGLESQDVLETLLHLYRETGEKRFLEPVPAALTYFRKSLLPDSTLARFYELRTNKPLYFNKNYQLTYNGDEVPTHYRFRDPSRLDGIEAEYKRLLAVKPDALRVLPARPGDGTKAREAIDAMTADGGWLEPGTVRDAAGKKVTPAEGVVQSQTFIDNVRILSDYLRSLK